MKKVTIEIESKINITSKAIQDKWNHGLKEEDKIIAKTVEGEETLGSEVCREKYLEALDVVETYHQQLRQNNVYQRVKTWNDLSAGDKIVFDTTLSKFVTVGKEYEIISVDDDWKKSFYSEFMFICDNGKQKLLSKKPRGYRVRLANVQ